MIAAADFLGPVRKSAAEELAEKQTPHWILDVDDTEEIPGPLITVVQTIHEACADVVNFRFDKLPEPLVAEYAAHMAREYMMHMDERTRGRLMEMLIGAPEEDVDDLRSTVTEHIMEYMDNFGRKAKEAE